MNRWEEFANTALKELLYRQLQMNVKMTEPEIIAANAAAIADAMENEYRKRNPPVTGYRSGGY